VAGELKEKFLKNQKAVLLSMLALAIAITVGCGGGGTPTFTKIAFRSNREAASPLFVANLDGSSPTSVTNGPTNFIAPSISADGKKIAFISGENVSIMNADGTGIKQLTTATDDESDNNSYYFYAKLSPNGKKILASYWDGSAEAAQEWIMNADGSNKKKLLTAVPDSLEGCYSGNFSADGRKIAFNCYSNSDEIAGVYFANSDGSNVKNVFAPQGSFLPSPPMFSPDGKKILFVDPSFTASPSVKANAKSWHKPNFASLGTSKPHFVAPHGIPSTFGIVSVNLDATGIAMVVLNAPEGVILNSNLYYSLNDEEVGTQIWKSNVDGTGAVKVSDGTSADWLDLEID